VVDVQVNKYRRGTRFHVKFPTLPSLTLQPRRIDIYQKQNNHDVLVLEMPGVSPMWFEVVQTGVPVSIKWQQGTQYKNWIGYVASISKLDAAQTNLTMEIVCVGSSFPLKERTTRVFTNVTIPEVVNSLVTEAGFNYIGENHRQRFPQLTIAGSSYWEWIQEQAAKIGYGVMVDGMSFLFRPLDKLIDQGFASAPILSISGTVLPAGNMIMDRTLDSFKVLKGDNLDNPDSYRAVKTVGGVDPVTNEAFTARKSPASSGSSLRRSVSDVLFSEYRADRVINDGTVADVAADGLAQMARFTIPAKVKCQGDPRIRPFGTVYISGTGKLTDGYWVVKEARHILHAIGDYQMELTVVTDGVGETRQTTFRNRDVTAAGTVNLEDALNNGGKSITAFEDSDVAISITGDLVKEGTQGYNRTPSLWKAVKR